MKPRVKLTEKIVRDAEPIPGRDYQIFDGELRGFAVCIYRGGGRAFTIDYRYAGRQRRMTLGRWPDWSVAAARERAKLLRREVDAGIDPLAERGALREAPRICDLIARYEAEHLVRLAPTNAADQRSMMAKLIAPEWNNRLVEDITKSDVEHLLAKIAKGRARPSKAKPNNRARKLQGSKPTPIRANRVGEVLRKMFNLAIEWEWRTTNPANGFYRRIESPRERFLTKDEIERLASVLERAEDQRAAGIIRLCMLTGARVGEVRQSRFEQFNLDLMIWSKPAATTKQRRVHRVPISADVAAHVRQRQLIVPKGNPWLFPGDVPGQPVKEIRRFWTRVQREAELPDVRIHDLRHTFASLLVSGGASLEMIGKLLGHTQMQTTQRYAHLLDAPLRAGVDAVAEVLRPKPRLVQGVDASLRAASTHTRSG
ncbi:tyrosine-type recombinase/integrase [Thalassobacter stenotrophicus]|uniref:tyrosine-type recombinase/integrase n=1 Tax=Thalassobacter stenotrophicus TaxID=266809 RepID=UPI000D5DA4B4|nr:site-specific integrase [Thalassobacter stenotrophicus]PVZ49381.1 integrase [Thalassobacter stenotrophicus]